MTLTDILNKATDKFIEGAHDIVDTPVGFMMKDGTIVPVKNLIVRKTSDESWSDRDFVVILSGE